MKLKLITVGKLKEVSLQHLTQSYLHRIRPFTPLQIEEIKETPVRKGMPAKFSIDQEGEAILDKIPEGSYFIALDERGKQKTTQEWAEIFRRLENEGRKEITFVIGGAYGLSDSVIREAHERLALSKLTFTHEMAQVIFLEQVYRVYTILRGIPYHHGNH